MTVASSLPAREHSPVDITSHRFWAQTFDERDKTFAQLRAADGLTWHRPLPALFDLDTINEIMLLTSTGAELAKFRRANPGDDLMTSVVNAEVDGHRLTDEEVGSFMLLLASAGNDTTKQATSHAMIALVANPEERDWEMADFGNRIGSVWPLRHSCGGPPRY